MFLAISVLLALFVPVTTEIEFVTVDLSWAIAEKGYEAPPLEVRVSGSCPHGGVGYAVAAGALPPGIQLSRLGYFSGAPLHTGEFAFTVRASDGCGSTEKQFTLVVTGAPVITATPMRISFLCKAGEAPRERQLRVSATWPRLAYRLTASNPWLTATPEHGATPRQGSAMAEDIVHLHVDSAGLKPGHYSATITLSSWQALQPVTVDVELTVN
jgi:putative Ig domain-containing protein